MAGLLIVHTGNGKGKTTAALGLAVRAIGHGMRVAVVQFIKGNKKTGEATFFSGVGGIDFFVTGTGFVRRSTDPTRARESARSAWQQAVECLSIGTYDMVILDELTHVIKHGFVSEEEVLAALGDRKPAVHVVVTGRNAPTALRERADLVTEIESPKHPYRRGVRAQRGIEF